MTATTQKEMQEIRIRVDAALKPIMEIFGLEFHVHVHEKGPDFFIAFMTVDAAKFVGPITKEVVEVALLKRFEAVALNHELQKPIDAYATESGANYCFAMFCCLP